MADSRFFPWFKLELLPLVDDPTERAVLEAALKTLMPIDRNFYQADIKVEMRYALVGNSFDLTVAGLSGPLYDAIKPQKTGIRIHLGYYNGNDEEVLEGVITHKSATTGDCFYETKLRGIETAFYELQKACISHTFEEETPISDVLRIIGEAASVEVEVSDGSEGIVSGAEPTLSRDWSPDRLSGKSALEFVANRLRRFEDYAVLVRDNKIWYAGRFGPDNHTGIEHRDEISYDNYLVKTEPAQQVRRPSRRSCSPEEDEEEEPEPIGYDFEMLGDPRLKAGDTVTLLFKDGSEGPVQPHRLTIESIKHEFSRENGYRCKGRALNAEQFMVQVYGAMAPGAEQVGDEVNNLLARNQERFPAVNVGDVTDYTPQEHLVNATLGLEFEPTMTSPSIQVRHEAEGFALQRRPLASPFAWNLCGLVVPVYAGMRAVAVHNRYLREDALLNGFIWTEEMTPPPNQVGDYWLCLPLDVPEDRAPNNTDKAANDLTTGDGKRVIQLKGLRLTIGEGLLPNLGSRPENLGVDDELQIEHSSGAKITLKANQIEMEAGERTLTIANNKVSIS